jgi:hypothetical protein
MSSEDANYIVLILHGIRSCSLLPAILHRENLNQTNTETSVSTIKKCSREVYSQDVDHVELKADGFLKRITLDHAGLSKFCMLQDLLSTRWREKLSVSFLVNTNQSRTRRAQSR